MNLLAKRLFCSSVRVGAHTVADQSQDMERHTVNSTGKKSSSPLTTAQIPQRTIQISVFYAAGLSGILL
uniref:Uncharacterized protein n=1 Tax=Anguilla anguilla TaxID=7936 RepID=A0A0E9R0U0_ANGAN